MPASVPVLGVRSRRRSQFPFCFSALQRLLFVAVTAALVFVGGRARAAPHVCAGGPGPLPVAKVAVRTTGTYSAMVIFAKFGDQTLVSDYAPSWASGLFNRSLPGSFAHFYQEMSGGLLQVGGQVLPRRYSSLDPAEAYLAPSPSVLGDFGRFNLEILAQADADTDFGLFDNDGPDGIPNSGDDDGYVDIVFINLHTVPRYFLLDRASGYASLNLDTDYLSDDPGAGGGVIRVRSRFTGFGGTTQRGHTFSVTSATMCHEFGHVLGLVDLFDQSTIGSDGTLDPAEDSAGIGKWGLMGLGTGGWGVEDGPNAFSAWSLAQLGWVDVVDITADVDGLVIPDAISGRQVFRLPLSREEYFLLEGRQATGSYYNRNVPASGLLIWHVDEHADNDEERHKQVDLVCADGLFADRGYPGAQPDPVSGGDNLDFFAKDAAYAAAHNGNEGDATDPFDGVRFTRFAYDTNPRAAAHTGFSRNLPLGIAVENIRARGADMVVDVRLRQPVSGYIAADTTWSGTVDVSGDVVVAPGARLVLEPGTQVRFASFDWNGTGFDPARCELLVYGDLVPLGTAARPVTLRSSVRRGSWSGLYLLDGQDPDLSGVALDGSVQDVVRLRLPPGVTRWSGAVRIPTDLRVPADAELIIDPGTLVRFALDIGRRGWEPLLSELNIEGRLTIAGAAGAEVTFTSDPLEEDAIWYGVVLEPAARADVRHLLLERAAFGFAGRVDRDGSLDIAASQIRLCAVSGLRLMVNSEVRVSDTTFRLHRQQGVRVEGSGRLVMERVEVVDNGREGVFAGNTSVRAQDLLVARNGVLDPAEPRSGMVAVGGRGQSLKLEQVDFADNTLHGLELDTWEGQIEVRGGQVQRNSGDGVRVHGSPALDVQEVTVNDNAGVGISMRGGVGILEESFLSGNGTAGVLVGAGARARISRTVFERGPGLVVELADSASVTHNRFATAAIGAQVQETPVLIRHNQFVGNQTGLLLRGAPPLPEPVQLNVFLDNAVAVDNQTGTMLEATANYWGTADSSGIAAQIRGPVHWVPFLLAEPDPTAVAAADGLPFAFSLGAPYPNPFNGAVTLPFIAPGAGEVACTVFDVLGRPVRRLRGTVAAAGLQQLVWDGRGGDGQDAASGVYLYWLGSGVQAGWGRIVLLR